MDLQYNPTPTSIDFNEVGDKFLPGEYLKEYYSHVGKENESLMQLYVKVGLLVKELGKEVTCLEFGGGPTIYQLITLSKYVKEIHFADYLKINLETVKKWQKKGEGCFDWTPFFRCALRLEGELNISDSMIAEREELLRKKITRYLHCDAFEENPLGSEFENKYRLVCTNFVPESITDSKQQWKKALKNIVSLLDMGGVVAMSALKGASYWRISGHTFPAVDVREGDVEENFKSLGLKDVYIKSIDAEVLDEESQGYEGYKGLIFAYGVKSDK